MRRILLSQSQVSLAISSSVIVSFTFLLFLSGYIIQQRTVTGLQAAIKPRLPHPPPSHNGQLQTSKAQDDLQHSRFFDDKGRAKVAYARKAEDAARAAESVNWARLAHVQIARTHHDVCNAVMVLAELHNLKSPARRILLFPRDWAEEKSAAKGEISDPFMDSSRRLMRIAARRYGVELRPIQPVTRRKDAENSAVYSLASAFALTDLDRVLSIETPGMLLDARPLDAVLAFTENALFAILQDTMPGDGVHSEDLILLQPSAPTHARLVERVAVEPTYNDTLLPSILEDPLLIASSSDDAALVRSIGALHDAADDFNATAYLNDVSYIRFSDSKLPGPEYDVPWADKLAARPKNKDADWTWTKLYGQFSQKRMEICGLDLETWRR